MMAFAIFVGMTSKLFSIVLACAAPLPKLVDAYSAAHDDTRGALVKDIISGAQAAEALRFMSNQT
ncbi:MAG: hypothetical protein OSB67_09245 [Alphaproteobacteria bacterium]|jgi:hypothetical protein|nr:hypothetical protein [Alphaproteobacteria bacterium]